MFLLILIFNIIFSLSYATYNKDRKEYLKCAKQAYEEQKGTWFYPKTEVMLRESKISDPLSFRYLTSCWLILIIGAIFFQDYDLNVLIVYIVNYIYFRITYWLAIIEEKIDIIKKEVYKED